MWDRIEELKAATAKSFIENGKKKCWKERHRTIDRCRTPGADLQWLEAVGVHFVFSVDEAEKDRIWKRQLRGGVVVIAALDASYQMRTY